jgi:hypothetical protein
MSLAPLEHRNPEFEPHELYVEYRAFCSTCKAVYSGGMRFYNGIRCACCGCSVSASGESLNHTFHDEESSREERRQAEFLITQKRFHPDSFMCNACFWK